MKPVLLLVLLLTGCTSASLRVVERDATGAVTREITLEYFDFHPGGNAVETSAVWESVGSLEVRRDTDDADALVKAAVDAAKAALIP